jgi:hypothetical protein
VKTKHAREIRKGILFANRLNDAILITKDTKLRHFYWAWYTTWQHEASKLSIKAFWRRTEKLQAREWFRLLNQLWNVTDKEPS